VGFFGTTGHILIGLRMDCQDLLKTMFSRLFIRTQFWTAPLSHDGP